MSLFKPAEIRAILILSVLVLIGSALTLLKRQGRLSSLDLDLFLDDGRYNYTYRADDIVKNRPDADSMTAAGDLTENVNYSTATQILDINDAGYFDLQTLPGIGPVLAERIVAYRDSVGAFRSVNELSNVKGIGEKKLAGLKNRITVR
jgi:comEA protein